VLHTSTYSVPSESKNFVHDLPPVDTFSTFNCREVIHLPVERFATS
jgi:hypothetical protein